MSEARDDILALIRRSLGVTGREAPRRQAVAERLAGAPSGLKPARGQVEGAARLDLFVRMAEASQASVAVVAGAGAVPAEIARMLRAANLPATLRMGEDARLAGLPWAETALSLSTGPSAGADLNAVSHAEAGIAETGTLVLVSGPHNPSTLNFLPDNHIVVVREADLAGDYETVWERLRARYGKGVLPRTVNWITGPSRSGDIEQKLLLGAHGPRRVHIIVVREGLADGVAPAASRKRTARTTRGPATAARASKPRSSGNAAR